MSEKSGFLWLILVGRFGSGKTLSELHIHYKSPWDESLLPCTVHRILQKFYGCPKMIDVIDKKQMHDSVATGKEYASEDWTCVMSMFLTSFNVYFACGCACFMCICLKTVIWLFWDKVWLF